MGLFDRFKKKGGSLPARRSIVDEPLIGSEIFEGRPVSAREYLKPLRRKIQAEYLADQRDPESLEKVPSYQRDEQFWVTYIDSLMVFEKDGEALTLINSAVVKFPNNRELREMKSMLEKSALG